MKNMMDEVKDIIEIAKKENMYEWLVGLDSPGPTPRNAPYYRLLYLLAKEFSFKVMVDLGTCEGVSAMCMARGNPKGEVYTVDRHDKVDDRCKHDNITYFIADAIQENDEIVMSPIPKNIELLYIDIEHTPKSMEMAFERYEKSLLRNAIVILDGVTWQGASDKMPEWWENFNPEGFYKHDDVELHPLENAGTGILIKK